MLKLKIMALSLFTVGFLTCGCHHAVVQVGVGGYGPPPDCPYGYYEAPPYDCAPDGYYGPEWFPGGVFIGAGPWYHGPAGFYGHVDHHYDYRKGYHGPYPHHGDHPAPERRQFHGQAMHDPQGHEAPHNHR